MSNTIESKIAADLDLIDAIEVLGTKAAVRKARAHRKACFAELKRMNQADGLDAMSDDDILAELSDDAVDTFNAEVFS